MLTNFPATLLEALQKSSTGDKSLTHIKGKTEEVSISYRELESRAIRLLYHFQAAGLEKGSELILLAENNEQFIDVFWAALMGGIIPVPLVYSGNDASQTRVEKVFRKLQKPFLCTTEKVFSRLKKLASEQGAEELWTSVQQNTILLDQIKLDSNEGTIAAISPKDTAFIQFSSGSTGSPKGVILSHENIISNISSILIGSEATPSDISLSWMPLTHDMGIIGFHLMSLVLNIDAYSMPSELFARRPVLWLEKISEKQATISSSPNFGYHHLLKYFNRQNVDHLDLSSIRLIFNGAEPISAELCRRFVKTLKPYGLSEQAIFPVYGLAEASLGASFPKPGDDLSTIFVKRDSLHVEHEVQIFSQANSDTVELTHLGRPMVNSELHIVDSNDNTLDENFVGYVKIRGPNVTAGYYHENELNKRTINTDNWLDTGDLGFINQGQLVITGRSKELIIVNGQNYHPHDLEKICESVPGVDHGKFAACAISGVEGEELAVFVVHRGAIESFLPLISEVRRMLTQEIGIEVALVIPVATIPKTTSGKIQRFTLAEQYAQGKYVDVLAEIQGHSQPVSNTEDGSEIEQNLLAICHTVFPDKTIGINDDLFEIGSSSLNLAQIHEKIDQLYPDVVEVTDLFDYPTIAELGKFLEQQVTG